MILGTQKPPNMLTTECSDVARDPFVNISTTQKFNSSEKLNPSSDSHFKNSGLEAPRTNVVVLRSMRLFT